MSNDFSVDFCQNLCIVFENKALGVRQAQCTYEYMSIGENRATPLSDKRQGFNRSLLYAGVDEVGRGPLAGPVVTAAVILDPQVSIAGLCDSKKLTAKKREAIAAEIQAKALAWAIGRAEVAEIDRINILQATFLAMQRAVAQLTVKPELVLVDGNNTPQWDYPSKAIVRGDQSEPAIAAASILAKVTRDQEMGHWDTVYPHYQFKKHKGYPTQEHMLLLQTHGVSPIHRRSFKPVQAIIGEA